MVLQNPMFRPTPPRLTQTGPTPPRLVCVYVVTVITMSVVVSFLNVGTMIITCIIVPMFRGTLAVPSLS